MPPTIITEDDLAAWLLLEFPNLTSADVTKILAAYPGSSGPVNPDDPKFATSGLGPATALTVSQVATGQQQRGNVSLLFSLSLNRNCRFNENRITARV